MIGKNTVVVVVKKKKNYIYSKIPRFQRFARTTGKMRKHHFLRFRGTSHLPKQSSLHKLFLPTGCPIFKSWNFGIFRSKVVFSSLKSRTCAVPIFCSKLELLYIRAKYWNSKLEFCFCFDSKIPISDSKIPTKLELWNKFHAPLKR